VIERLRGRDWLTPIGYALAATIALVAAAAIPGIDARSYFDAGLTDPYRASELGEPGYVYTPVLTQLIEPLRPLGWDGFRTIWILASVAALVYMVGPWLASILVVGWFPPLIWELDVGNVNLFVGAAIWAGFRYPALWMVPLLTKPPMGMGLAWFAVRGEWRNLAIATGATATIALISFALAPHLWADYIGSVTSNVQVAGELPAIPWLLRLPLALGLVIWGALRSQHWTVPLAAVIVHPSLTLSGWVIVLGFVRYYFLRRQHGGTGAIPAEPAPVRSTTS
jgi:hypothetical protein